MTSTPTGGTGTVTVATATGGGTETTDLGTFVGFLYGAVQMQTGGARVAGALLERGFIRENKLPFTVDANGWADAGARFIRR